MTELFNLPGLDSVDQILHPLILALPVFVLATLVALVARLRRAAKAKRAARQTKDVTAAAAQKTVTSLLTSAPETISVVQSAAGNTDLRQTNVEVPQAVFTATMPAQALTLRDKPTSHADAIAALQSQFNDVMKVQPNNTLAPLFLEMARHHKAAGDEAAYLAALRSAAGLGAQYGPRAAHADARLQLAEAAFNSGDLTGACEQWQMARDALLADGQKEAHARVEQRMRDNGCPTDWVLTDF